MSGNAVFENVRRYRAIASLFRQTAAFRPIQRNSLLGEAERWEYLALSELEAYFSAAGGAHRVERKSEAIAAAARI
jgi:hypothetical protein